MSAQPSDEFSNPCLVIHARTIPNLAAQIVSTWISELRRNLGAFATEIVVVTTHQDTICTGVSSDMIGPDRSVRFGVERVQLKPCRVIGRTEVDIVAAALLAAAAPCRSFAKETEIVPIGSKIQRLGDLHCMDQIGAALASIRRAACANDPVARLGGLADQRLAGSERAIAVERVRSEPAIVSNDIGEQSPHREQSAARMPRD